MTLFSKSEMELIEGKTRGQRGNILITFKNSHGPTALTRLWQELLSSLGLPGKCVSWWSGSGTVGLLECERTEGANIYGQWALADSTELMGIFQIDDDELTNIREGFESGNVTSSAMRAVRIGETFDRD